MRTIFALIILLISSNTFASVECTLKIFRPKGYHEVSRKVAFKHLNKSKLHSPDNFDMVCEPSISKGRKSVNLRLYSNDKEIVGSRMTPSKILARKYWFVGNNFVLGECQKR